MNSKTPETFEELLSQWVGTKHNIDAEGRPRLNDSDIAHILAVHTTTLEAAKREARDAIGQDLPHSTAKGNSLEIWSWKTPTGRKWNAAYIDSKRRPVEIATGDSIAEALDKLAHLNGESSR
jgi:hypothetical protein